jgi:integrase
MAKECKGGELASRECPECHSKRIWKDGLRDTNNGLVQRSICRECGHRFSSSTVLTPNRENNRARQVCVTLKGAKNLAAATEIKTVAGDTTSTSDNGLIVQFAWYMKKKGLSDATIGNRTKLLKCLVEKGANLTDPNSVETILATETWKTPLKRELVQSYLAFCKFLKIPWEKLKVRYEPKQVYIPTEEEIDALISGSGNRLATFLQVLKDTGARKGEAVKIKHSDVNSCNNTISINSPGKGSKSRTVKVSEKTIAMINALPRKYGDYIFSPNPHCLDTTFNYSRRAQANKLQNPNLLLIHFHTLRHVRAKKEFRKHKNIYDAKYVLGHKSILSTARYTEGEEFEGNEYYSAEAKTKEEAKKLIEAGYSYVTEIEGVKLFSKPK